MKEIDFFNVRKKNIRLYLIVLAGLILRIIAFPFAQSVDADATSRLFFTMKWMESPYLIYNGVWLPFHYYFNAIAIVLFGGHYGPVLFHIIIASLTAIPIYNFTKREFSEQGAWISALFYLLCPVVFRNSFHTLSGIPHAFFIASALNHISKSIRTQDHKQAIFAGLYITIAAGFRYEGWLLIALFTLIYLLFKDWKNTFYFLIPAMIFPTFWMIGNYIAYNDIFRGLTGAYNWNVIMEGVNDQLTFMHKLKRLVYFPFIWFFLYSPFLVTLVGWNVLQRIKHKKLIRSRIIWSMPFWVLFIIFIFKAYQGTLLLQQRFTISLILLSSPFISIIVEKMELNTLKKAGIAIILTSLIPMSYLWMLIPYDKPFSFSYTLSTGLKDLRSDNQHSMEAIPRLSDQKYALYSKEINQKLTKKSGLILDFISWENTFFLAQNSQLSPKQIFIFDGSKHGAIYKENLVKILQKHPNGVILLKCFSKFSNHYELNGDVLTINFSTPLHLKLKLIDEEPGVGIFEYQTITHSESAESTPCLTCPELNSLD